MFDNGAGLKKLDPKAKPRFSREVAILYEDSAVVAIDKPAGLLAVPFAGSSVPSALSLLKDQCAGGVRVVHRIDRFSSGALLFAKTDADREILVAQFLAHTPVREYLAVVRGHLVAPERTLVHYMQKDGMWQKVRTEKDPEASRAELSYVIERPLEDATLVRATLVTGLQNQIRAQFAAIGHPVIGDRKYRPKEAEEPLIDRVALHAAHLEFEHPRSGRKIVIDCPPPKDFQKLVRALAPKRVRQR